MLGWLQKPRTVSRREEVRQRVERGDWHGSEIARQDVSFSVQSARQARTLNGKWEVLQQVEGVPCAGMGQKWVRSIHKQGINKRVVVWLQIQKPSIMSRRAEVQQRV